MSGKVIVVVGAGLAGWSTIRELRKRDTGAEVVLISADEADFYSKPAISNALAQGRSPAELVTTKAAQMAESLDVKLMARTSVVSLDTAAKSLRVVRADGSEDVLTYTHLVLANGAEPVRVPVQGNSDDVLSVNHLEDYRRFRARLGERSARVLIMGAGLIGCEFAEDLAAVGHAVYVVDPAVRPLASMLPELAAARVLRALTQAGVHGHFGTSVEKVERMSDGALRVSLASGVVCEVDVVLSAVGLRANTGLARDAGIHCDRGVIVDAYLQTSARDVYALGDVAQYGSAGNRTLPYVMPILHAARALGATLAGERTQVAFPIMPVSIKMRSLPAVLVSPESDRNGSWEPLTEHADTAWRFVEGDGKQAGFVLLGSETSRRAEMLKSMTR